MDAPPTLKSLRHLRHRVRAWTRTRLWAQVLAGLVLGLVFGTFIGPDLGWVAPETAEVVGRWVALPGNIFLRLISMVLAPLVLGSIVLGLTRSESGGDLRSVGLRFMTFVVVTTTMAAATGIALAQIFEPGAYVDASGLVTGEGAEAAAPAAEAGSESAALHAPDMIAELIPANLLTAVAERNMLAIVIFAVFVGMACLAAGRDRTGTVLELLDGVLEISMVIVKWAIFLVPYAVFGLMAQVVARVGLSTLVGLGAYVLTVVAGLFLLLLFYLVIVSVLGHKKPLWFLSRIGSVQLLAFSTSSTAAVMPLSVETAVKKLGVKESVANLVVPLAATVNMAGTALYQSVAIIFLAQMAGVDLATGDLILIVVTLVASSIGAPGTPGVGIVILENVALGFGIPTAGLVLILGVDRILDMCRTSVNVTGDLVACVLFGTDKQDVPEQEDPELEGAEG